MKKAIHPVYRPVVFQDVQANKSFMTRSTIHAKDTIAWEDGKTYPLVKLDISAFSHPFYTGQQRVLDTAGRIDRFKKRFVATEGKTVARKAAKSAGKQLAHVGHTAKREKILSTAPTKEQKAAAKKAPKAEKKAPAKKD
ncbi:MAG TPA: 50S ribosomal protein L31 type B [Elusimicrobia bacterium]|nr:MAG: 50S ribosomal protein L31 [Elusimicrobia bacterium GWA2_66_18]OGR72733.1 MAG: 50S ribosomal protein L31 [Elusimicrobia bacterium GWC2_65_9]HAZ08716.1 50S ribosomal protein L31 type B [Elusimicrobiota bacterium]